MTLEEIRERLFDADMLAAEAPPSFPLEPPWYFRAISGCGAWLACLFLLGFWAMFSNGPTLAITFGAIHAALALALASKGSGSPSTSWLSNLALALWLTGLSLILVGVSDSSWNLPYFTTHILLLAVAAVLYPEWLGRLLTMVFTGSTATLSLCVGDSPWPPDVYLVILPVIAGASWLSQRNLWLLSPGNSGRVRAGFVSALGYSAVVTLWLVLGASYWGWTHLAISQGGQFILAAMVLWLVARVVYRLRLPSLRAAWALGATLLVAILTHQVPGILAGLGVLLLGFETRSRGLRVLAALYWALFLPTYFYWLDLALTAKSLLLLLTGGVLLALRKSLSRSPVVAAAVVPTPSEAPGAGPG